MKKARLKIIIAIVAVLLLIPLITMQFTDEVSWGPLDFIIMGILLLGTGLLCDLVLRKAPKTKYKILIVIAVIATFLLVWAELAVGIFGSPFAGT